jgi:thymidylate kinase
MTSSVPHTFNTRDEWIVEVVRRLSRAFECNSVLYGVAHGLVASNGTYGRDIDIIVTKEGYEKALALIASVFTSTGACASVHRKSFTAWITGVWQKDEIIWTFEIDVFYRLQWRLSRICNGTANPQLFPTLSPLKIDVLAYSTKALFLQVASGNFAKSLKAASEFHALPELKQAALSITESRFGKTIRKHTKVFLDDPTPATFSQLQVQLRDFLYKKSFSDGAISLLRNLGAFIQLKFEWKVRCKQATPIIAIVGPDGIGKSTVLSEFSKLVARDTSFWSLAIKHWRPSILPPLARLVNKNVVPNGATPPRRDAGKLSFVRQIYYSLDFALGWLRERRFLTELRILAFDRCYDDMIVDPLRFGLKDTKVIIALRKLLQRASVVVVLTAKAETIVNRKAELTVKEIQDQYASWKSLSTQDDRIVFLDSERPPQKVAADILSIYIKTWLSLER